MKLEGVVALMSPAERQKLVAEIVTAARQKAFGEVCAFNEPPEAIGFRGKVGADGKENWLFHQILDQIQLNAANHGLPHFGATYEALGSWSAAKWGEQRQSQQLPECVPTHRGPLRSTDVLAKVKRHWETSLIGRSVDDRLQTPLGEFQSKVEFVVGSEGGLLWVATDAQAVVDGRWEKLSDRSGRHDRRNHLLAPNDDELISEAERLAQNWWRRGMYDFANTIRDQVRKKFGVVIKTTLAVLLTALAGTLGTYSASASFRNAVRSRLPRAAGVLDRLTGQPPPPKPHPVQTPRRAQPPGDIGRILELGDVVPAEPLLHTTELGIEPLIYEKTVATIAPLTVAGYKVQPQIIVTRSRTDPHVAYVRVFLGDLWRGIAEDYGLTFGDAAEGFIMFEASVVEQRSSNYRGFMTSYRYPKYGSFEIRLVAFLKDGRIADGIYKRINFSREIEKGPRVDNVSYLEGLEPYRPREEDIRPARDGELYQLLLNPEAIQKLDRTVDGAIVPQILVEHLGGRKILFRVLMGKQFENRLTATVLFDDSTAVPFGPTAIPKSDPAGFSVIHEFSTSGLHSIRVIPGSTEAGETEPPIEKTVTIGPPSRTGTRMGPEP